MAEWDEQRAAEIDWERFRTEKLYRALQTERGLPGPLPVKYEIDVARFRSDLTYREMIRVRGLERTPEDDTRVAQLAQERRWQLAEARRLNPEKGWAGLSEQQRQMIEGREPPSPGQVAQLLTKVYPSYCCDTSSSVVCISDPRFRVRSKPRLAAPRR